MKARRNYTYVDFYRIMGTELDISYKESLDGEDLVHWINIGKNNFL
jgi:hypothetical protein